MYAYSTQVSGFFEPSIQSTVDSIRDSFRRRLTVNSVRMLTLIFLSIAPNYSWAARVSRWWLCHESMVFRTTREAAFRSRIQVLQAGHADVSDQPLS